MDYKTDRNRRLADYIYDDLGPDEIVEVEREISNDPLLSESYLLNMRVKKYLQAKVQLEEMRSDSQLENAEKLAEMAFDVNTKQREDRLTISKDHKRNRIRNLSISLAVAATVSIIVAVGIVPSGMDGDRLFDRYYKPIEASDYTQRGGSNVLYRDIASGINNYMDGDYRQSIDQFNQLASDPAFQPEVYLFTALSYMELGEYRYAKNILEPAMDVSNRYLPETMWYLSLCYLKTGEVDKAVTLLGRLENYDGLYKEDARTLRKKLRRLKK
jgi:tetratricopeptide (TPR) repeat protein